MTRLSSWILCSKWLAPPKRFFVVPQMFPNLSCTFVSECPADFVLQKRFCGRFPQLFSTSVSQMAAALKSSLEGSASCALHLPPSLLLGSKLHELLKCLNHTNPVRTKRPIMSLLLGYSLGLFLLGWIPKPVRLSDIIYLLSRLSSILCLFCPACGFGHFAASSAEFLLHSISSVLEPPLRASVGVRRSELLY